MGGWVSHGLETVLGEVIETAIELTRADFGNIQLVDADGGLRIVAQRNFPDWWVEHWNAAGLGHGACGAALGQGQRVIVEDIEQSPIFAGTPALEIQRRAGVRAVQSTPLISSSGQCLGMLSTHYRAPYPAIADVLRVLDLLASHAVTLIEHVRDEALLRASEERFRALVLASSDVVYRMSPDWTEMRQLVGREFIADTPAPSRTWLRTYIHPDDQPRLLAAVDAAIRTKAVFELEHRVLRVDGSLGWMFSRAVPMLDAGGEIAEWVGMASDITARKAIEEERERLLDVIQAERDLLQCVMNGAGKAHLVYLDRDFNFVRLNATYAATCGYRPEEMIGRNHFALYPHPENEAIFRRVRDTGEAVEIHDKPFAFPDAPERGVTYWDWTLVPVRDGGGQVTGLIFSLFDTTARVRAEAALKALTESLECKVAERTADLEAEIAQRLEVEAALRASETQLRTIIQQAPIGITRASPSDGRLLAANPAYCAIVGYGEAELIGRPIAGITDPEDREADREGFRQLVSRQIDVYAREKRYIRKDGGSVWVEVTASMVWDAEGQPLYTVAMISDITERKRAQDALGESRHLLRSVIEHAPVRIFWKDPESRYLGCNALFAMDAGLARPEDVVGRTDYDLAWRDLADRYRADDRSVMESGMPKLNYEEPLTSTDEDTVWLRTSKVPLRGVENGMTLGILGVYEDITERKATDALLAESIRALQDERNFMDAVLDTQAALVLVVDGAGRLVRFSQACETLTGYDFSELRGSVRWLRLVPAEERADIETMVLPSLRAGVTIVGHENHLICKDGSRRQIYWRSTALRDAQGLLEYVIGTGIDITDLRQAEEAAQAHLEEASWLQRLTTANELATMLAHELNQPLAAIATYVEVGRQTLRKPSPDHDKLDANLARISEQALRAGDIIRHLRSFISRGSINPVPMDLNEVVQRASDLMAPRTRRTGFTLEMQLDPGLPQVMGVDVQVEQVLLNLLRNAFDAMQEASATGGTLTVQTQRLGDLARVTVTDSGPGIDANAAARLFEPLTSRKPSGLGVGLRISRSLIEAHGGRLWVEPRVPGAMFHFELPLQP